MKKSRGKSPDQSQGQVKQRRVKITPSTNHQLPLVNNGKYGSSPKCPKCQGFLVVQHCDYLPLLEIRCINCSWQPQWGTRMVTISEEIRSIRGQTSHMFSHPSLRLNLTSTNGFHEKSSSL